MGGEGLGEPEKSRFFFFIPDLRQRAADAALLLFSSMAGHVFQAGIAAGHVHEALEPSFPDWLWRQQCAATVVDKGLPRQLEAAAWWGGFWRLGMSCFPALGAMVSLG